MFIRSLVVVGWMGLASLVVNVATAEDAVAPVASASYGVDGISFADIDQGDFGSRFSVDVSDETSGGRFFSLNQSHDLSPPRPGAMRQVEVALSTRAAAGFDVGFAQRASLGVNEQGDIERQSRGSEVRLGRGLTNMRRRATSVANPAWYFFAASDDEALTWQPGGRNSFGGSSSGWALQDRVEIGDRQAGVTYQAGPLQASLAYVEREINVRAGAQNFGDKESFTGLTLTMRHP